MGEATFMETKREVLEGFAYANGSGQIVIDACASDDQHLGAKATHTEQPLYRCRTYLKDLIPKEWLNQKGKFLIERTTTIQGEVVAVQIAFVPSAG